MGEPEAYDPLDYRNLTVSLVRELMDRAPTRLPLDVSIGGPGVGATARLHAWRFSYPRNAVIFSANVSTRLVSHSQMTRTSQPISRSAA